MSSITNKNYLKNKQGYTNRNETTMARSAASPPSSFTCPLSLSLMEDPVQDTCGHNFERSAIIAWMQPNRCCPISRKPLSTEDLRPNHALAEQMERWKWQRDVGDALRERIILEEIRHSSEDGTSPSTRTNSSRDDSLDDIELGISVDSDYDESGHVVQKKLSYYKKCYNASAAKRYDYESVTAFHFNQNKLDMLLPQERQLLELVQARQDKEERTRQRQRTLWMLTMILVFLAGLTVGAAKTLRQHHLR